MGATRNSQRADQSRPAVRENIKRGRAHRGNLDLGELHSSMRGKPSRRIICVGQLTADTNVILDAPLVHGEQRTGTLLRTPGGTAAIVAHNAALLGGTVSFCGHIGSDEGARQGIARLESAGVCIGPTIKTAQSAEILVLVSPGGERTMVASGPAPDWSRLTISTRRTDIVFFEGWGLFDPASKEHYETLIRSVVQSGARVAVDVVSATRARSAKDHASLLRSLGAAIVFGNAAEAKAYQLLDQPPAPLVFVHAGELPTTVLERGARTLLNVRATRPVDSTGAGDTFAAGVMAALARGESPRSAAHRGHMAARLVLDVVGSLLPKSSIHRNTATLSL